MQELKQKEMTECTFKPHTNEMRNRELLRNIMAEEHQNQLQGSPGSGDRQRNVRDEIEMGFGQPQGSFENRDLNSINQNEEQIDFLYHGSSDGGEFGGQYAGGYASNSNMPGQAQSQQALYDGGRR